jgi:hypothetical protein
MAVTFNAASPDTFADNATVAESASFAIAGSNLYAFGMLGVFGDPRPNTPTLKWGGSGGVALTRIGTELSLSAFNAMGVFGLVAPTAQTSTVYASWTNMTAGAVLGMVSYTNVDQTTPINTVYTANAQMSGATATATVTVPTTVGKTVVAFCFAVDQFDNTITLTAPLGFTDRYNANGPSYHYEDVVACIVDKVATTTSTVMSVDITGASTGGYWGIVAFEINESLTGSTGTLASTLGAATMAASGTVSTNKNIVISVAAGNELRDSLQALITQSGVSYAWYDAATLPLGSVINSGTVTITSGEVTVPVANSTLANAAICTLVL